MKLRSSVVFAVVALGILLSWGAESTDFKEVKQQAEKLYAEHSYSQSHDVYARLKPAELDKTAARWVRFRLADTQWRAQAGSESSDTTKLDQARSQLDKLIRDITRTEDHDLVWAEVQESLADFAWTRRNNQNWSEAWPHYQQALDWWAGAPELETARGRYLGIIWKAAKPPRPETYYYYGYFGNYLPVETIENGLKIAQTANDQAHLHFLLAMTLKNQGGDWEQRSRVPDEFEAAIKAGQKTEWYDDALYNYGEWMVSQGRAVCQEDGTWTQTPDYVEGLKVFRRLVKEFKKGETRYWEQAQQQIKSITEPQIGVVLQTLFLPDSEIQYSLNWRNVDRIDLAIYPVELNRDVQLGDTGDWLHSIDVGRLERIKAWSKQIKNAGDYKPGNEMVVYGEKLKPGAYLIEAAAGGKKARDLILVSDGGLVLKSSGKQALVFFANAVNSEPFGGAKFKLWERWHDGHRYQVRESEKVADKDGIAVFELAQKPNNSVELFASAILKDRQAFATGNSYWQTQVQDPWKIYAFTDRPAYRPNEKVRWKFVARRYDGSVYSTPTDQKIEFQIDDPRGAKVKADKVDLNSFGSAWGSLELTESMPLGEYRIAFWDEGRHRQIGSATLFRLEEYKLPEFKVSVQTPEEKGADGTPPRKKAFRVGEKVEVNIQADYYYGAPVANASVEVLVYQNPFYHYWSQPHEYPWLYEDMENSNNRFGRWYGGGNGQIIKRETIKTDATGKASLTFETPKNSSQDFEYRIEARVTDSSRREISGSGTVRVTRQRYYVYATAQHSLYHPQDKASVEFKALDANEQPVRTEGLVKVTRDRWYEVWVAPDGHEVKGEELNRLRSANKIFPPPPKNHESGWTLKFQGYEHEGILSRLLTTDSDGKAEFSFTPEREGYYRVAWTGFDTNSGPGKQRMPITAETTIWVASGASRELGYRYGGVQIIVDKDTFHVGQKAPVMLVAPSNDRNVLFTVEGDDLYSYQLVHLDGTVKLIEVAIEEKHVPNIFLNAALLCDRQLYVDTKQVVVPPVKNFLTVKVQPDRGQYQPRDKGSFIIRTQDHQGRPVPAEVAFSLVDESVFYIQQDYAGDPRQFYFGTKREHRIQTQCTMNYRSYARLVREEGDVLKDDLGLDYGDKAGAFQNRDRRKGEYFFAGRASSDRSIAAAGEAINGFDMPAVATALPSGGSGGLAMAKSLRAPHGMVSRLSDLEQQKTPAEQPAVEVRSDFRSTISWEPAITTDKNGEARVTVKYPDSLTGWKATARAVSQANQFGIAETNTHTRQPLMVRLQAPRFFVVGDTVVLSASVNNDTDEMLDAEVSLEVPGDLKLLEGAEALAKLHLPAHGEGRADWKVLVTAAKPVKLKAVARAGKYADAMERTYGVFEHGLEKFLSKSGKARVNDFTIKLDLPKRKTSSTSLTVQVTPSMAVTMLDALPYLIDYPYGCTEQTMSRFLPAAITAKTLKNLGLEPADIMGRVFGGIEKSSASATHPKGKKDLEEMNKMVQAGLDRLYDFQHGDGGWGWWKQGDSDHWMTAYVLWGLTLARDADVTVKEEVVRRAADYLDKVLVEEEENYDMQAWLLHALSARSAAIKANPSAFQSKAFENLWSNRDKLNAYTRALLALSAHQFGKDEQANVLLANLENGVNRDERPDTSILLGNGSQQRPADTVMGTAHWGEDGIFWHWSEGGVEATAFALRALIQIDPKNKLIEPVTNWLIKNRRGAQWNSTRDTAMVILAMNDYLRASGELESGVEFELLVNGASIASKKISKSEIFSAPSRFTIDPKLIKDSNEIRIRRKSGSGSIYFAVESKFFSLEEPIAPAGNEIFVKREYYKLVGRPTLLKGYVYDKQPLRDGETVKSGERVESVITVEAKNNYEYLMFEDLKPSGLEAVEVRSGESVYARELKSSGVAHKFSKASGVGVVNQTDYTGRSRWVYQELRDRKVAMFLDKLPQGTWEIRYDLRAEVPGQFHTLPVTGAAMYVPEIRCNSAEIRINVAEAKN